ncbi:MAG: Fe-S-containing hydro-lyase [Anaerovoracaceae bacterium]|jgi:fumarate hydratase subunit beta
MKEIRIQGPFTKEKLRGLRAGDSVLLSGTIFTARDAAHKRMIDALADGRELPFPIENAIIYYVGPTPASPGRIIGSAGPTTSYRMDAYAPRLLDLGQAAMIGKGPRGPEVLEAIKRNGAVYFAAIGGAGALISKSIRQSQVIAYEDLGAEAVRQLTVVDFPAIVAVDSEGGNLYRKEMK